MRYHDALYGSVSIDEPLLIDLIHSPAVQRLRGVLQHGVTSLLGMTQPMTRFEHSVGVMLLVRSLGAGLEEQVTALLHDVSHTAFSHVIDYVFGDHDGQSYHEARKAQYVAQTDLPRRLAAHGFDWRDVMDEDRFPLLEQPTPALCADRLDYFLRDIVYMNLGTQEAIARVLECLVVADGKLVIGDLDVARWLAYTFMEADKASWANFREVGLYELTAQAIRAAMASDLIVERDLWGTDAELWDKLKSSRDAEVRRLVRLVSPATRFVRDEQAPTFRVGQKLRTVDPAVSLEGVVQPLSAIDKIFARHREEYLGTWGIWPMRVVSCSDR